MRTEIIIIIVLGSLFHSLGRASIRNIMPIYIRPEILRGNRGDRLFFTFQVLVVLLYVPLVVWAFLEAKSIAVIIPIILSFIVAEVFIPRLFPDSVLRSAFGPIISTAGLSVLNVLVWMS
jgi:hypothetical protein